MSATAKPSPTSSHLPALALWLTLQLLVLVLPTLHIPLSDDFPRPIERLAIHEMLVVQVTAAAMLFPMLFRNASTTVALIASTWPFLQLSGMLSATPAPRLLSAALYLTIWMMTLALCASALKSHRARLRAAALATSFTLAGPLLCYLHRDYNENAVANEIPVALNPVLSALTLLNDANRSTGVWIFISALLVIALAAALMIRQHCARNNNLSTSHPQPLSTAPRTPPDF